jgi:hypothetical protein
MVVKRSSPKGHSKTTPTSKGVPMGGQKGMPKPGNGGSMGGMMTGGQPNKAPK